MHGFILNWREVELGKWIARSVVSFNPSSDVTDFVVTELPYGGGCLAEMDGSDLGSHDDIHEAMAVCEARFVEWGMPAIYRANCENHASAMKVMERLGRKHLIESESEASDER